MIKLKRLAIPLALFTLSGWQMAAQDTFYALPSTTIVLEVEARQEIFYAGPYAAYAHQLLNMGVRDRDEVNTSLTKVELYPTVEADPSSWFSCDAENVNLLMMSSQGLVAFGDKTEGKGAQWRFPSFSNKDFTSKGLTNPEKEVKRVVYEQVQTDTAIVSVPVEHRVLEEKTLEDKAMDAADMILKLRKARLDISTGDTDAQFDGQALDSALKELDRIEKEYLALFRGYSEYRTLKGRFDVTPSALQNTHSYLAFRLGEDGFFADGNKGVPYYIELEPEAMPRLDESDRRKGRAVIRYRVPVVCNVILSEGGKQLLHTRIPIYQLGVESTIVK